MRIAYRMLNLSSNALLWFDYAFIPRSLEVLDIHSNNIDSLGNFYALRDYNNLKYIDASVNAISSLNVLSILPGVVEINLSNNIVSHIAPKTFTGKKHLTKVHLERNRLETLDTASLMVSLGPNNRKLIMKESYLCPLHVPIRRDRVIVSGSFAVLVSIICPFQTFVELH